MVGGLVGGLVGGWVGWLGGLVGWLGWLVHCPPSPVDATSCVRGLFGVTDGVLGLLGPGPVKSVVGLRCTTPPVGAK